MLARMQVQASRSLNCTSFAGCCCCHLRKRGWSFGQFFVTGTTAVVVPTHRPTGLLDWRHRCAGRRVSQRHFGIYICICRSHTLNICLGPAQIEPPTGKVTCCTRPTKVVVSASCIHHRLYAQTVGILQSKQTSHSVDARLLGVSVPLIDSRPPT